MGVGDLIGKYRGRRIRNAGIYLNYPALTPESKRYSNYMWQVF